MACYKPLINCQNSEDVDFDNFFAHVLIVLMEKHIWEAFFFSAILEALDFSAKSNYTKTCSEEKQKFSTLFFVYLSPPMSTVQF